MTSERIFGTDGIRGRAGEGWLAPRAVASVGAAIAESLTSVGTAPRALVAHDGRRSGPELEAALARGLASRGFGVTSAGLITTPGLAFLTRQSGFDVGVMISASHNPAEDNGIKVFSDQGDKLSDELERGIEARLRERPSLDATGPPPILDPALEVDYLGHLTDKAAHGLALDGLSILVDCANGGASRVAPRVFGRLGAHVTALAAEPDGENINRECGATSPAMLQREVRTRGANLGIALDGDGDRCILVDERGEIVHGDGILTILARDAVQKRAWSDPRVVATVMSNRGLFRALREVGVGLVTTDVGDRRVVEALRREGLALGGEQSGHVVFGPDNFYIGDGIYTALRVLSVVRGSGRPLSELASPYRAFPQVLVNVPVARKPSLQALEGLMRVRERVESELGDDGRVLLRYSGTEPLLRIMVEGPDLDRIKSQAQELAGATAAEIGA